MATLVTAPRELTAPAPLRPRSKRRSGSARPANSPRRPGPAQITISTAQFDRLTVIHQVKRAFLPGARLAGFIGLVIGGFVPVATWTIVHLEVAAMPALWLLVGGGLLYSALTVFQWGQAAFGNAFKASGFCVLLEGILTFGHTRALSLAALAVLVFINAVSAACALQVRK
jgi:hypothetical protein